MKYFSFVSLFTLTALNAFSQDVLVDTAYRKFNTLVVTNVVNKIAERKTRIANEVNAISSEQIKAVNSINTADLLQNTGNLFVNRNYQGGGSPII
jgi:hemoglobin/transferrin/lactoferrin receptor protein